MAGSGLIRLGELTFDAGARELRAGDAVRHLSPKAFQLLHLLIQAAPDAVSKAELYESLWPDVVVLEANLKNLVAEVRAALGESSAAPRFVRTVHRYGYALRLEEAHPTAPPAAPARASCFEVVYLGTAVPLRSGENDLGRDARAAVRLRGSSTSRLHARILVEGDRATIEDLSSKNGTWLNGRRVRGRLELSEGDELELASETLTFRRSGETATRTSRGSSRSRR